MTRQSALSAVTEQRKALMAQVSVADRAKLDQYFTSVRQIGRTARRAAAAPGQGRGVLHPESAAGDQAPGQIDRGQRGQQEMAELMAMALACNQTKVFNVVHTSATSEAYLPGDLIDLPPAHP